MKSNDLPNNISDFDRFQANVNSQFREHPTGYTAEVAKERFAHCVTNIEVGGDPELLKHQLHFCLWWLTVLAELSGLKLDEIAGER